MKVYVVCMGYDMEYQVDIVCSSKEIAEKHIAEYKKRNKYYGGSIWIIEAKLDQPIDDPF